MKSILQDWVMELGLRHQGVLLSAVRGCDTAPKDDSSKAMARLFRGEILNPHCGDVSKAASFMMTTDLHSFTHGYSKSFISSFDHYPLHYVMHFIHAAEIIGYHHPVSLVKEAWINFYNKMCNKLHMNPETKEQLDNRLNADEDSFAKNQ